VDLVGGEAGAARVVHGLDHAVDEVLEGVGVQLVAGDEARRLAEDRVADLATLRMAMVGLSP